MSERTPESFSPLDFARLDEGDDKLFYQIPRLVVHIDDQAIEAVGQLFREFIPPDSVVLDLMSSWRSHWPADHSKRHMVGLGLNTVEMQNNPDLDEHVIHDVNRDPHLPFDHATFDAAVITVSIQYFTRPIEILQEVNRILKPGGIFLVVFSNRMFFTKAVQIWRLGTDNSRMELVTSYFRNAGSYEDILGRCQNPQRGPFDDPVYSVTARKPAT